MDVCLKWKYRCPKSTGRYKSTHNDGRRCKRNKTGKTQVSALERVLVLTKDQKLNWEWR